MGDIFPIIGDMRDIVDVGDVGSMVEQVGEFGSVLMSEQILWRFRASQRGLMGAPGGPTSPPNSFSTAFVWM